MWHGTKHRPSYLRGYIMFKEYTPALSQHMRPTLIAKGEKKVRKALKLLPYRIIGHFNQNGELGFFF